MLASVDSTNGLILDTITEYVGYRKPNVPISQGAARVHGLNMAELEGKSFDLAEIITAAGCCDLVVAHNAPFDRRMMAPFIPNMNLRWGCSCNGISWPTSSRALDAICVHFGIERPNPHNALTDVKVMISAVQQTRSDGKAYLYGLYEHLQDT